MFSAFLDGKFKPLEPTEWKVLWKYYNSEMFKERFSTVMNQIQHLLASLGDIFQLYDWDIASSTIQNTNVCLMDWTKLNKLLEGKNVFPTNRLMKLLCKLQYSIRESIWYCLPENIRWSPMNDFFFLVKITVLIENNIFHRNNTGPHFGGKSQVCYDYFP